MGNDTRCTKDLFDGQKYGTWKYLFEVLKNDTKLKKTHRDNRFESHKSLYVYHWRKKWQPKHWSHNRDLPQKFIWLRMPRKELLKLWSPTEQK